MSSAQPPTSINPLLDRYLNSLLTFKPGKRTAPNSSDKPSSYIVLSKSKKSKLSETPVPSPAPVESPMKPKPRSMAEAVAAYTGKKFLTKSEKKLLNKQRKQAQLATEDLGEAYLSHSEGDSNYESASEYLERDSESPFAGFSEANSGTSAEPETQDASEEDDEDFEAKESAQESSEESSEGASEEASEEASKGASEAASEAVSEASSDVDEDLDQLKSDLREDALKNPIETPKKSAATPPTSPEDGLDAFKDQVTKDVELPPLDFYDNSNDSDRGSNNSTRIYKNWRELSKSRPVGLLNHGVTCYMNSAIQALVHIPAVQHYLNEINAGKHNDVLKPRSVSHVLAELSKRMWGLDEGGKSKARYINPKKIIQRLDDINCMMSEWQQEDSHEYFMSLMSRLQEDSTPKGQKLNQSVIHDIFGGLLDQQVTCFKCKNVSETKQEFYDLSLGLNKKRKSQDPNQEPPSPNKFSIEKSIRDFFSNETIKIDKADPSSGYYCEKCQQRTMANKISYISRSPETLTIHLKRFKFNGNSSSKMKQSISYSKYLDLTEYTTDKTPTKFKLISVIVHEGRSISSGHYVAHCLQPDGTWSTYDDEYINKINEREALSDPAAYVLVYTKLTPKESNKRSAQDIPRSSKKIKV